MAMKGEHSPLHELMADQVYMTLVGITLRTLKIYEVYPANWINSNILKQICSVVVGVCQFID